MRHKPPWNSPLNVAVLSGGESAERQVSLASGRAVIEALLSAGHRVRPIDPATADLSALDWSGVDVCFIALHGGAGEDGRVQAELDALGVAYTGSGPAAARLAMSKSAAKAAFRAYNVPTPPAIAINRGERWDTQPDPLRSGIRENSDANQRLPPDFARSRRRAGVNFGESSGLAFPLIVKPDGEGSSLGVGFAADDDELRLRVADAQQYGSQVLVEQWIDGREFTVALLGRRPLPLIEIITPRGLFDYEAKYESATTEYRFEHGLTPECEARLLAAAVAAAQALGTDGLCRVDLMLDGGFPPKKGSEALAASNPREITTVESSRPLFRRALDGHASHGSPQAVWVLEVNTSPGLTDHSLAPKAAARAGLSLAGLCDWMLHEALAREVAV